MWTLGPKRFLVALSLLAAASLSCRAPKAGDRCSHEADETCVTKDSVLECHEERLVALQCRGPGGCSDKSKRWKKCDRDIARTGDVCIRASDSACADNEPGTLLACINGHFVAQSKANASCAHPSP